MNVKVAELREHELEMANIQLQADKDMNEQLEKMTPKEREEYYVWKEEQDKVKREEELIRELKKSNEPKMPQIYPVPFFMHK